MRQRVLCPAFVTTFSAAIATVATACGDRASRTAAGDGGVAVSEGSAMVSEGGAVLSEGGADCPAQIPTAGSACNLPDTLTCDWTDACGFESEGSCDLGKWSIAAFNPPAPGCPTSPPQSGTPCRCPVAQVGCPYPMGTCNGQPLYEVATCQPGGNWQVSISSCNPPAVEAGTPGEAGVLTEAGTPSDAGTPGD